MLIVALALSLLAASYVLWAVAARRTFDQLGHDAWLAQPFTGGTDVTRD